MQFEKPKFTLTIDDNLRPEVVLVEFSDQYGLEPAQLVLNCPDATFNQNLFKEGQSVVCEMLRDGVGGRQYVQYFKGLITTITDNYSFAPGVSCVCQDMRILLKNDMARRDYNTRNPVTQLIEEYPSAWSISQIIDDVVRNFFNRYRLEHSIADVTYQPLRISGLYVPTITDYQERKFRGKPIAEILMLVTDELLDGSYQWVMKYQRNGLDPTPVLELVNFNGIARSTRQYYYGTDALLPIEQQNLPGRVNINSVDKQEDYSAIEDRIIVLGDQIQEQRLVKCTPYFSFPRVRTSFILEGEWSTNVPDNNPKRLSQANTIGLYMEKPEWFLQKDEEYNRITNPHYNPDMEFVGRRFLVLPHLMYDPRKSETPEVIEQNGWDSKYLAWEGEFDIPAEMLEHCSWRVPEVEEALFTLPLNRALTNANYQALDTSEDSVAMVICRFYTDILNIQRLPYFAAKYLADPFDKDLLWVRKYTGVSVSKGNIMIDEQLIRPNSVYQMLVLFPAADAGANAELVDNVYNPGVFLRPLGLDAPSIGGYTATRTWDATTGLTCLDITWPEIVKLFDDLFEPFFGVDYFDAVPSVTGNHFLRWFGIYPDHYGVDAEYAGSDPIRPIIAKPGIWTLMWNDSVQNGNTVIYSTNVEDRTPPAGFVYANIAQLNRYSFYEFPYEIYANVVVKDTRHVRYDSGKRSSFSLGHTIIDENADFKRQRLGRNSMYVIDYRNDRRRLGILPSDHDRLSKFGNIPDFGIEKELGYTQAIDNASEYYYPLGYDLVNHASDIRQENPPLGVLHLDEPSIPTGLTADPDKSKMGKYGLSKLRKSMIKSTMMSITIEQMDFSVQLGDKVDLNHGALDQTDPVRIVGITHRFYGGDPKASNQTILKIATVIGNL